MPDANPTDPFQFFDAWFAEASASEPSDANAMTVATASPDGLPAARTLLLKGVDPAGTNPRGFVFYTNKQSRKGDELAANGRTALLFYWKSLARQIRIEGTVTDVTAAEADAYFVTRPRISRLGAWASQQSRSLESRAVLEARLAALEAKYPGEAIPRPPHWSGYRLIPRYFEFWQAREFRLHDRLTYTREGAGWRAARLNP
jgi:pyridoxamine 5'-phosphate oxidase